LCVNKSQFVPVIFEPPCNNKFVFVFLLNKHKTYDIYKTIKNILGIGIHLATFVTLSRQKVHGHKHYSNWTEMHYPDQMFTSKHQVSEQVAAQY
jgi:hypothetical protein